MVPFSRTISQLCRDNDCTINFAYGRYNTLRIVVQKDKYIETIFINNQDEYKTDSDVVNAVLGAIRKIDDQIERIMMDSLDEVIRDWCIEHDCTVSLKWNKPGEIEITREKEG